MGVAALIAGLAAALLASQGPLWAATVVVALGCLNARLALPARAPLFQFGLGLITLLTACILSWSAGRVTGLVLLIFGWRILAEARWWALESQRIGAAQGALAGLGPWTPVLAGLGLLLASPAKPFAGLGLDLPSSPLGLGLAGLALLIMGIWVASRIAQRTLGEPLGARDGRLLLMGLAWPAALGFTPDVSVAIAALAGCRLALAAEARWRPAALPRFTGA